jgi:hypothetical protein
MRLGYRNRFSPGGVGVILCPCTAELGIVVRDGRSCNGGSVCLEIYGRGSHWKLRN